MDVQDLTDALTAHSPDPSSVLAAMRAKRSRQVRRRALTAGCVFAVAVLAASIVAGTTGSHKHNSDATAIALPEGGAAGCAETTLEQEFADARDDGASVILAKGNLTGRSAPLDGEKYAEMRLTTIRTLSGPTVRAGSQAWIPSALGPGGPLPSTSTGSLWAPDGSLFAIIWHHYPSGNLGGPIMRVAPVVKGQLVLSTAGCWSAEGTPNKPFTGPLAEIPGSDSYRRAEDSGFRSIPLSTVEYAATR